jgi:DNA polymerase-3 subunit epsilon
MQLSRFIGNHPVVAHNCSFEQRFLAHEYALLGIRKEHTYYCTMRLARDRVPRPCVENHKLQTLLEAFEIEPTGPMHRALPDAEATAELWCFL